MYRHALFSYKTTHTVHTCNHSFFFQKSNGGYVLMSQLCLHRNGRDLWNACHFTNICLTTDSSVRKYWQLNSGLIFI